MNLAEEKEAKVQNICTSLELYYPGAVIILFLHFAMCFGQICDQIYLFIFKSQLINIAIFLLHSFTFV